MGDLVQREHPQNSGGIGVGSLGSTKNLQCLRNGARLLLRTNRKSYTRFRSVPISRHWVTLNGVSRDCPKFFKYPLLSQVRVKLRTSNLACTFTESIRTKGH